MREETGWVVNFITPDGDNHTEPNFPQYEPLQPNQATSKDEGQRVLDELKRMGDGRDWFAYGFPRRLLRPGDSQALPTEWWCIRS